MSTSPNTLGRALRRFFTDHLPRVRGASSHTVQSYRDAFVLLLRSSPHNDGLRLAIWILVISVLRRCWISFSILKRSGTVSLQRETCASPQFTPSFGTVLPSIQTIWSYVSASWQCLSSARVPVLSNIWNSMRFRQS